MNAMPDIGAIAAALSSLKAAKDISQAMVGLGSAAAFQEKRLELQSKILDAQESAFTAQQERTTLLDRVSNLEKELANAKAWEAEKQRYELQSVHAGAFAYSLKPQALGAEPAHWLCAACYDKGQKSVLQRGASSYGSGEWPFICPNCKSVIYTNQGPGEVKKRAAGEPCPKCGEREFRIESSTPHPTFGVVGVSLRQMKCGSCGFTEGRQHHGKD
jgi:Zn finger protein HypA/HybF involved in hydrogenase expression